MKIKNLLIPYIPTFNKRLKLINEKSKLYGEITTDEDIYTYQINKFNRLWKEVLENNSFYAFWAEKHNLPNKINSINDLHEFPVLTKKDIQENRSLIFDELSDYYTISTGGSTGVPAEFPTNETEKNYEYANTYLGRSWWGIQPLSKTSLFWGHSHLFGTGINGKINEIKRRFFDWLINTERMDAYNMNSKTIKSYSRRLLQNNPECIIGYTSLLSKLAKYINEEGYQYNGKKLKAVIATSETIYEQDYINITKAFNVPLVLEYGMAETSVIAYSQHSTKEMKLFWDSFIGISNDNFLNITTLNNRLFPLINYDTGDKVKINKHFKGSIFEISEIFGRDQQSVIINTIYDEPIEVSGILIIHILKSYKNIYSIQFKQLKDGYLEIYFTATSQIQALELKKYFIVELKRDYPSIDQHFISFFAIESEEKTLAGKEKINLK